MKKTDKIYLNVVIIVLGENKTLLNLTCMSKKLIKEKVFKTCVIMLYNCHEMTYDAQSQYVYCKKSTVHNDKTIPIQ